MEITLDDTVVESLAINQISFLVFLTETTETHSDASSKYIKEK